MVQEDEGGGLQAAVDSLIARGRRKRCVIILIRHLSNRDAVGKENLRGRGRGARHLGKRHAAGERSRFATYDGQ